MQVIFTHMRLPFFRTFSNFVHFCQIFKYFALFKNCIHAFLSKTGPGNVCFLAKRHKTCKGTKTLENMPRHDQQIVVWYAPLISFRLKYKKMDANLSSLM